MTSDVSFFRPTAPPALFGPRGPLSALVLAAIDGSPSEPLDGDALLRAVDAAVASTDVVADDDVQLTLFTLYALAYGSLDQVRADLEWSPELITVRTRLEAAFETDLRARVTVPEPPAPRAVDVAKSLRDLTGTPGGPSLARFVAKRATVDQLLELIAHRTIYTLREADPHSWAIPRLTGRPKAALVEIQSDEYGGGNPDHVHATIFARTVRGVGMDERYGTYVDNVPALTLASHNLMSLFGLNRRLLGAVVGHLAAFEMTSSIPSRLWADGFRRHGFGEDVTSYFDEHVEADAVHEQIAAHDLAGSLAEDHPELVGDIMFGAAACLQMDEWFGEHVMTAWREGRSSLRLPLAEAA